MTDEEKREVPDWWKAGLVLCVIGGTAFGAWQQSFAAGWFMAVVLVLEVLCVDEVKAAIRTIGRP